MDLLIFRTDIKSKKKVKSLKTLFNKHSGILKWSIDLEDIDNVLRIEAKRELSEKELISIVKARGFYIKPLTD